MKILRALKAMAPYLAVLITLLGIVNFFWVLRANEQYGGGALNGYVRNGHYYLAMHGTYTEVSRAIWENIRLHELGLWFGAPLVAVSFGYLMLGYVFPMVMGLRQGEVVEERVRAIQATGMLLASGTCSGSIGGVSLGGPLIYIEVYPGGITVRPFLNQPVAILKSEMRSIKRSGWSMVEIVCLSPDISGPIMVHAAPQSVLGAELDRLGSDLPSTTRRGSSAPRYTGPRPGL